MASNKFVFTKEAEIDIDQAIYYIVNELGDKSAAKRLYDKLFYTIQRKLLILKLNLLLIFQQKSF